MTYSAIMREVMLEASRRGYTEMAQVNELATEMFRKYGKGE